MDAGFGVAPRAAGGYETRAAGGSAPRASCGAQTAKKPPPGMHAGRYEGLKKSKAAEARQEAARLEAERIKAEAASAEAARLEAERREKERLAAERAAAMAAKIEAAAMAARLRADSESSFDSSAKDASAPSMAPGWAREVDRWSDSTATSRHDSLAGSISRRRMERSERRAGRVGTVTPSRTPTPNNSDQMRARADSADSGET